MKFRTQVGILTVVIIGLFAYAVYLSFQVQEGKSTLQKTYDELLDTNQKLEISSTKLQVSRDSLENVMKQLNVWETGDQKKRERQEQRKAYKLGVEVQANNANYQKLIAYVVSAGFEVEYVNQNRGGISESPRIYIYSEKSRPIALELKNELEKQFPNLQRIGDIRMGGSSGSSNLLAIKLRFN